MTRDDAISINSMVETIVTKVMEDTENFIFVTITPYCEEITKREISKKDLERALTQYFSKEPCNDAISRNNVITTICQYGVIREKTGKYMITANEMKQELVDLIDSLPPVTPSRQWIPVNERLPEDEQEILFSTKTGRVHSGKYHDDNSANQWYSHRDKCSAWNNVVTAWIPLPKPYGIDKESNNADRD